MNIKILVIVESLDINDSSATKGRIALINNLLELGYSLKILHYTRRAIDFKTINIPSGSCTPIKERKLNVLYFLSRTERIFTRVTKLSLNRYLENWFGFSFTHFNDVNSIKKAVDSEDTNNYSFVLTLSKGASFKPHFALLKSPNWYGKWIAYIHDPFPYHFYPRPYNWIQPGFKQKERLFREVSKKAAYSAFPSLLLKDWMSSYFDDFGKTGRIIPHQIQHIPINNHDIGINEYIDRDKFTILHAGNLMKQRNPIPLIKGYFLFLEKFPEAKANSEMLLIGAGTYFNDKINELEKQHSNLHFHYKSLPFNLVFEIQKAASVNVILESKSEISPFLPGKFPHCIVSNKPIMLLGPYYSESKRILGENYPLWAESDDVSKICEMISSLYIRFKENKLDCSLEYERIKEYLGTNYLKKEIESIIT